jgi:hypothetical protein
MAHIQISSDNTNANSKTCKKLAVAIKRNANVDDVWWTEEEGFAVEYYGDDEIEGTVWIGGIEYDYTISP